MILLNSNDVDLCIRALEDYRHWFNEDEPGDDAEICKEIDALVEKLAHWIDIDKGV